MITIGMAALLLYRILLVSTGQSSGITRAVFCGRAYCQAGLPVRRPELRGYGGRYLRAGDLCIWDSGAEIEGLRVRSGPRRCRFRPGPPAADHRPSLALANTGANGDNCRAEINPVLYKQSPSPSSLSLPSPPSYRPKKRRRRRRNYKMPHAVFATSNVAVITGAASGIGLAIARLCASHGLKLLLTDINGTLLAEVARSFSTPVETVQMDVGDRGAWRGVREKVDSAYGGRVDLLVLNAGIVPKTAWEDVEGFKKVCVCSRAGGTDRRTDGC